MFEVRVEADFSAAHFLRDYNGKCENLHGHNYKVYAHVRGFKLNEGGMLMDFTKLKAALRAVCKEIDHTNLNDLCENGVLVFKQNPSAERIAKYIFDKLQAELKQTSDTAKKSEAQIYRVDVFETPTSRATYRV